MDIDSIHRFQDDEKDEGEGSALVAQARMPIETAKPSELETLPHGEETLKKDVSKAPESPEVVIVSQLSISTPEGASSKTLAPDRTPRAICSGP